MKKIIAVFIVLISVFCLFSFAGCKSGETSFLTNYVSELRNDIFEGTGANYEITAYGGFREAPYLLDGKKGKTVNYFLISIKTVNPVTSDISYEAKISGKTYTGKFAPHAFKDIYVADLRLDKVSDKTFTVKITGGETEETVTMASVIKNNIISHSEALLIAENELKDTINRIKKGNELNAEVLVRLNKENDKLMYYVAIVSSETKTSAVLIDAENKQIMAKKEVYF